MPTENANQLVQALVNKTNNKQTIWNKSSNDGFELYFDSGAVTISYHSGDFNNNDSVRFKIFNSDGDVIEDIFIEDNQPDYSIYLELYNSARRVYYKVEETIKGMFTELKSDFKIGIEKKKENSTSDNDDLPF